MKINFQIIFVLIFMMPIMSWAQAGNCMENIKAFEDIDYSCIRSDKYELQFKNILSVIAKKKDSIEKAKLRLKNEINIKKRATLERKIKNTERNLSTVFALTDDNVEKLLNSIYFYKTGAGFFGKMIIRNISTTRSECSMYVDVVTYEGKQLVEKSITFVTENISNSWNVDRASFDNRPGSDFLLRREGGLCVFKKLNANMTLAKRLEIEDETGGNQVILYAALFLIGLAVFLVARTVFQDEDRFKAQEKLEDAEQGEKEATPNDIVLKYSRPFFKRYFSPIVQGMKGRRKLKEKYKRPLASSGMNKFLTPEDFYAFKLFLIIGFPLVFLALRSFLEESWPLSYVPLLSIAGYFYPDFWIKGKIEQRRINVIENMPFVVDMLALSVEAGLDFIAAMQKVIEKAPPSALADEFETLIKDTKIGASRAEALRGLAWRIDALPVSSFCATLVAADSVGANIGPILKTLAQELREKRSSMAEQKGAQAATKILIPMIFLVLPAVLLVIAAPIALQMMNGGG